MLPPRELSPNYNRHAHWGHKAKAREELAEVIYYNAVEARNRQNWVPLLKARLTYTFVYAQNRDRDLDNLLAAMKRGQDQLVKARIIVADDWKHLKYGDHQIIVDKSTSPLTIIEIIEV